MSKAQKFQLINLLKREGVYIRYCKKDGYVYELVRTIRGQSSRYLIGLKNGSVNILRKDRVWQTAA